MAVSNMDQAVPVNAFMLGITLLPGPLTASKLGFCTRLVAFVAQVGDVALGVGEALGDGGGVRSVGVGGTVRVAVGVGVVSEVGLAVGDEVSVGVGDFVCVGLGLGLAGGLLGMNMVAVGDGVGPVVGAAVGTMVGLGVGVGMAKGAASALLAPGHTCSSARLSAMRTAPIRAMPNLLTVPNGM